MDGTAPHRVKEPTERRLPRESLPLHGLWLLLGPLVGLVEWPYQALSEAGFRLQQELWSLAGAIPDRIPTQPGVEAWWGPAIVFVSTVILLALSWGPLSEARGGGVAPIIALDQSGQQATAAEQELWLRKLSPAVQLRRLPLMLFARFGGMTVGTESPSAALGAGLLLGLRDVAAARNPLARLPADFVALVGGAAGLGAAFRSPLLGVLYGLEELGKRRGVPQVLPVLLLAGTGTLAATRLGQPARLPGLLLGALPPALWGWAVAITVAGALVGGLLVRLLIPLAGLVGRWMAARRTLTVLLVAAALALFAVASDGLSLNDGSLSLGAALRGQSGGPPTTLPWRMLATLLSVAAGAPGGIMHDTMTLGALLTSPLQGVPGLDAAALARLAAIGATSLFAAANGTPIFCAAFVFTLQGDPSLVPALLLASAVSAALAAPLRGTGWNEHQAERLRRG